MAWQAGGTLTLAARKRRTRPPTSGLEGDDIGRRLQRAGRDD